MTVTGCDESSELRLSRWTLSLEASNREIQGLNKELRHQVGVRSHELAQNLVNASSSADVDDRTIREGDVINERYHIEAVLGSRYLR